MVTSADRAEVMRTAFGEALSERDLSRLIAAADEWQAHEGEALIVGGGVSRQGFVVVSGVAELRVGGRPVAQIGPGSCIWSSSDAPGGDCAEVVATTRMWLLMLAPTEQAMVQRRLAQRAGAVPMAAS